MRKISFSSFIPSKVEENTSFRYSNQPHQFPWKSLTVLLAIVLAAYSYAITNAEKHRQTASDQTKNFAPAETNNQQIFHDWEAHLIEQSPSQTVSSFLSQHRSPQHISSLLQPKLISRTLVPFSNWTWRKKSLPNDEINKPNNPDLSKVHLRHGRVSVSFLVDWRRRYFELFHPLVQLFLNQAIILKLKKKTFPDWSAVFLPFSRWTPSISVASLLRYWCWPGTWRPSNCTPFHSPGGHDFERLYHALFAASLSLPGHYRKRIDTSACLHSERSPRPKSKCESCSWNSILIPIHLSSAIIFRNH